MSARFPDNGSRCPDVPDIIMITAPHRSPAEGPPRITRDRLALLAALLLCGMLSSARGDELLKMIQTIDLPNVEGRIDHMAYDAKAGRLFVAAVGNHTVEVIDVVQGHVMHTIRELPEPQGIAIVPAAHRLYVACAKDGSCRAFDDQTFAPLGSTDLKEDADNVRYDDAAGRLYVGYGNGGLAVLNPDTGKHLSDIRLPAHPESFQFERAGGRLFVNLPEAGATVAVVNRDKGEVTATWRLPDVRSNYPMALDEAGHRLFIACREPATLVVLDTEAGKPVATVRCAGDADDVWYDTTNRAVYVSGGEGSVTVVRQNADGTQYETSNVSTSRGARTSLLDAEGRRLYVAVPHRGTQSAQVRVYQTSTPPTTEPAAPEGK